MPSKNALDSRMLSLIPPDKVQALFGDPPLLQGEDIGLYNELMCQFAKIVEPKDMIEWWWVKDITDHSWEIRRLRRFKVHFIEGGRHQMLQDAKMLAVVGGESMPMPDSEKSSAEGLMRRINQYKSVDTLIASAELRRAHTLREIERRREYLARRLRKASDEIIDGELAELPQAAE
jgi:hypothetical protein